MSLPFTTTTVTIERPSDLTTDPGDGITLSTIASGVGAVLSSPSGREQIVGGQQQIIDKVLYVDGLTDLTHVDTVTDAATGTAYSVSWVDRRPELGLDHLKAGLKVVTGAANG